MLRALRMLRQRAPNRELLAQAFASTRPFLELNGLVASYDLWDRIGADPRAAIQALAGSDPLPAGRAEWMLTKAGAPVLPAVRNALDSADPAIRTRAIRIVAWQADAGALQRLRQLAKTPGPEGDLSAWAIGKIEAFRSGSTQPVAFRAAQ
jgi:hypothetical protein